MNNGGKLEKFGWHCHHLLSYIIGELVTYGKKNKTSLVRKRYYLLTLAKALGSFLFREEEPVVGLARLQEYDHFDRRSSLRQLLLIPNIEHFLLAFSHSYQSYALLC